MKKRVIEVEDRTKKSPYFSRNKCENKDCENFFYKRKKKGGRQLPKGVRPMNSRTCCDECADEVMEEKKKKHARKWAKENREKVKESRRKYKEKRR